MSIAGLGLTNPVLQFVDGLGVPYAGGTVTFTQVGVNTLQNVYSDPGLTMALTNPVSLNAAGRSSTSPAGLDTPVYFQLLPYDLLLKDVNGVTVYGPITFSGSPIPPAANIEIGGNLLVDGTLTATGATTLGALTGGWTTITVTDTGTKNNYNPGGFVGHTIIRCNNSALLTLTGLVAGTTGQRVVLVSVGAGQVDVAHQNTGSTAANRFINFATSGNTSLAPGVGTCEYQYDATSSRWQLLTHQQGDFIEYAALSTIVGWSVLATTHIRYKLEGRQLSIIFELSGTSNATTGTFTVPYTSAAFNQYTVSPQATDNGTVEAAPGFARMTATVAIVSTFKDGGGTAWTNSGTKAIIGGLPVQVT